MSHRVGKPSSCKENEQFLSRFYTSREEFEIEYKKLFSNRTKAAELYMLLLTKLEKAISDDNIDGLKKLINVLDYINEIERLSFSDYGNDNTINDINLVVSACKHNKVNILEYLFNRSSKIAKCNYAISPYSTDESKHNAFYYAIRAGNIKLMETLINKWPGNYFTDHLNELDEILSKSYEELKLKNVLLSEEMEIFIENKLIDLRFFSNVTTENRKNYNSSRQNIQDRIELILENISMLKAEYSNNKAVDEKFLFIARFIVQNIHILKRFLKSTYDKLPWEEVEFFLVIFVLSHKKRQEMNLFIHATLNKYKILHHLEIFGKLLENEKNTVKENTELPKLKRESVVAHIINGNPQFEELYDDYQQVRDFYSLNKINDIINLALSTDAKQREGQLIITRVLQVIGEYLKNTLESPKLSNATSELLLLLLPRNTREIIIDLRNSLSHANALSKRRVIEQITDDNFFIEVQNDVKKIGEVINNIFFNNRIKTVKVLLKKIVDSESWDEIKEVTETLRFVELDKFTLDSFASTEHDKLAKLIAELTNSINDKTAAEVNIIAEMNKLVNDASNKSKEFFKKYYIGFTTLQALCTTGLLGKVIIDKNVIRGLKFRANMTLKELDHPIKTDDYKKVAKLSMKLYQSAKSRILVENRVNAKTKAYAITYLVHFGYGGLKSIKELRNKLNEKELFTAKEKTMDNISDDKYTSLFKSKLSELRTILRSNMPSDAVLECLMPSYKKNKKLQAVVDMLVLDIMSILGRSDKHLENNLLFLDDNAPLLTGKCLRNHLAHDNIVVDIFLSDASLAVVLNARKLISENVMKSNKKFGKLLKDDSSKLEFKYKQNLATLLNQEKMFAAIENGNMDELKCCLRNGSDLKARNMNALTALHFAAKGPNLEILKFVFGEDLDATVKDVNGWSLLHFAAAHGRRNNIEFLITLGRLNVHETDCLGKTPLHIAAEYGHKDAVEVLIKHGADASIHDLPGLLPLSVATRNNHVDVCKFLLKREKNIDINETKGGYTLLHEAAESGHIELVNFYLQLKADVNAKTDRDWTPLHAAAFNGHQEVVEALILKGANINDCVIDGCTTLHYAVENGHEKIANILLKMGANVNASDKSFYNTPLHYAAKDGHEGIVRALLKNKANGKVSTVEKSTPLHLAAQGGHLEISDLLLKHGVDIHAKDINSATPLFYAAKNGSKPLVELLINRGANINSRSAGNLTPLHVAAMEDHKDVIEVLVKHKVDIAPQDIEGYTPLHIAAEKGYHNIIPLLIKNEAHVNARCTKGFTPLHFAAKGGHVEATLVLVNNNADVNIKTFEKAEFDFTPLMAAMLEDHKDVVELLLQNKAKANYNALLNIAVQMDSEEIIETIIAKGANVNAKVGSEVPLLGAVRNDNVKIVQILIQNGANVNADNGAALAMAVFAGYEEIVEILLKNNARVYYKYEENVTLLHIAAKRGHEHIVNALIKKGASVDVVAINNVTPLYLSAQEGHAEVAKILIANKANVNVINYEGAPLHIATGCGHFNVVKVLLESGAKVNAKDRKNRTSLELAVAHRHFEMVKLFFEYGKIDVNAKGNDDWTILHIASQESNLDIVKYLVAKGANLDAKNASGSKPIHIAAREGFKDTVAFFLSKGANINDRGAALQTLLHYAALKGHSEVAKYLIEKGADVNIKDGNGSTPLHMAATHNCKNVVDLLLENGAIYNDVDILYQNPAQTSQSKDIINVLEMTEKLFNAVQCNSPSDVKMSINRGAFINAKNTENYAPLHYAAWKGYAEIANILLKNKANPNIFNGKGVSPVHYAAKFSHLKVLKALLAHGAVYNALTDSGKTPSNLATDQDIISLFELISKIFKKVKSGNTQVINDLNKISDVDAVKVLMSARNDDNETLVVAAIRSNFSKIDQLKGILQNDVLDQILFGTALIDKGRIKEALHLFRSLYEKRKAILGPDNPGTLDLQTYIAKATYKQGLLKEALKMFEEILKKQQEILGLDDKDTLSTRSSIALVLHRQENNEEAFAIFSEVLEKQTRILGKNDCETINTQFHMALVLDKLRKFDEALRINRAVLLKVKAKSGEYDAYTVRVQNNIAMVLFNQEKYEEAMTLYKEVFEKKKMLLGLNHADTLRTLHHIAGILCKQNKVHEAVKAYEELLQLQKNALGRNHPDTLNTEFNMATTLFHQFKWISALKLLQEGLDLRKMVFGPNHPSVLTSEKMIEAINERFKLDGSSTSEILFHLQKNINIAASNGDVKTMQDLLKKGADVNDKDVEGRTPLHFAISSGHVDMVQLLLKYGANACQATNKGNTPLHTATSSGQKPIIEILLAHVIRNKHNLINAKTAAGGTTALHVAAKNGSVEIVQLLLKEGAIYNVKNIKGELPVDLSKEPKIMNLFKLIDELFVDIDCGKVQCTKKLHSVKHDDLLAITNARNNNKNTLLQMAVANGHKSIATELLKVLKSANC